MSNPRRRRNRIAEQFIAHRRTMRESAAWRALPDNARRVLDRLELEHMCQGGHENGRLQVSYDQFMRAGIRRQSIPLAIRQCIALGFLEVTKRGGRTRGDFKYPSTYRLTYVHPADAKREELPTDEWTRFDSDASAAAALEAAADLTMPKELAA